MQHLTFLAIIFLSLTRTGQAMPPRPPPPPPLPPSPSPHHHFHWLLHGAAASAHAPKPPSVQPVLVLDGVPLDKIPRGLVPAALLREKMKRRGDRVQSLGPVAVSGLAGQLGRRLRRDATAGPDMNAVAFCRSDDAACIKMMEEYEQWRKDNGYGLVGGRWG